MINCLKLRVRRALIAFSLLLIILSLFSPEIASANAQDEAYTSIQRADEAVSSAFISVLEAENAGANVSVLIMRLNEAVSLLIEAKVFSRNGDLGEAAEFADRSVEVADGVRDEASSLKASALSHRDFLFKVSLAGSSVGVLAFLFFMFFLWRRFRSFYLRRVLRLRPEVVSDVEA